MTTHAMKRKRRLGRSKHTITRLACWNITSWNGRDQEIVNEMKQHKIDICALSETKRKGQGTSRYDNYILAYSGRAKQDRAQSGVGILLHEKYEQCIESIDYINDRIIKVSLKINHRQTHLISTYTPDISKPIEESETFYQDLQNTIDKLNNTDKIIILGDLNARIGREVIPGIKQKYNEEITNENGELLIDFCARNELRINNTYFPHKEQHKYTFRNTRDQKSMIDYVISNRTIIPSQVIDVRALTSANIGTDHSLLLCKMLMEKPHRTKKPPVTIEKFNIESLTDDSTRNLYENRLTNKLKGLNMSEGDVESCWNKIKSCIVKAAEESIGKRKVNINGTNNSKKPWFCHEIKELSQQKKKSYLRYRSSPTTEKRVEYTEVRNRINARIKAIKRDYWAKFTSDMDHDLYGAQKKVWKMLKNRKKPVNEFVQTKGVTKDVWESYFRKLYNTEEVINVENYETNHQITLNEEEVMAKIKKLKNRKAPGTDLIPNELLKYAGPELGKHLKILYNKILETSEIPTEWHKSITIPIFKKGQKTNPDNYRGITLLNTSMKLFTGILKERLETQITNKEEQQGFRRNRSTTDAIFIIKQLKEKSIEFNTPAYVCFIDLTKAFDRVRLYDIVNILMAREAPDTIVRAIHNLNMNNRTRVKAGDTYTEEIPTPGGIRQGDSLSPFLFNLLMDRIIEEVSSLNIGYRMGQKRISMVCYADDAAIFAETEDDLQKQLHRFYQVSQAMNMTISTEKTKSITFAKDPVRCKLVVQDKIIEQVSQFKYLGMDLSSHHDPAKDLRSQINKATAMSGCLRQTIWANEYMRWDSKVKIYKTCIRPIMTYGIETREETNKTKSMLRVAEMKTLRTIMGKTRRDRIKNTDIREQCEVQDIVRWGRQRKRGWYAHVRRMDERRLPRIALEGKPTGKREPGRPPKRWKDSWQSTSQELLQRTHQN